MFEAWKVRPEVAPILAKDFVLAHIDSARCERSAVLQDTFPGSIGKGIPWFVFVDADGKALVDSNGPKGNIGCPNTDEEIEAFIGMLRKVRSALTDDDLAALKASLVRHREKK